MVKISELATSTSSQPVLPRISTDLLPINYSITIDPDAAGQTFDGHVEILLQCQIDTKTVEIYSKSLNWTGDPSIHDVSSPGIVFGLSPPLPITNNSDIWVMHSNISFQSGHQYVLEINYTGQILQYKAEGLGFYVLHWNDSVGNDRKLFVTLSECCGARRIFPSWDEPGIKARFQLTLKVTHILFYCLNSFFYYNYSF